MPASHPPVWPMGRRLNLRGYEPIPRESNPRLMQRSRGTLSTDTCSGHHDP